MTQFITTNDLNPVFFDRDTGAPLAGGTLWFWQDSDRIVPKLVFQKVNVGTDPVTHNPVYDYVALPNPVVLSGIGTIQDASGNNVALYYEPYDTDGNVQLYYVACYNYLVVPQFTREGWPYIAGTTTPPSPPSGNGSSLVNTVAQTANGFSVGQLVYLNSGTYTLAQANNINTAEVVGLVSMIIDANNFVLTTAGLVAGLTGLTAGGVYYVSDATAGLMTLTAPTASGEIQKPVFVAATATSGYFINYRGKVIP